MNRIRPTALDVVIGALIFVALVLSCARQPTRVRVQDAADRALRQEQDEARRADTCRLLTRAARVARMTGSPFAGQLAVDAWQACHPAGEPPVWP